MGKRAQAEAWPGNQMWSVLVFFLHVRRPRLLHLIASFYIVLAMDNEDSADKTSLLRQVLRYV